MEPILSVTYKLEHLPVVYSFFLGVVGVVVPCQLTSNVSAITIYGNKSLTDKIPWAHVLLFIFGKILIYLVLGIVVWLLGQGVYSILSSFMPVIRKIIGPMLIMVGLFMCGILKWKKSRSMFKSFKMPLSGTYIGSFLMGVSFTLAFCPTMFMLFIFTLMPVAITSSYGLILPAIFGVGTSLPLLLVIFLIWYFGASGSVLKKGRMVGLFTQKAVGILLIVFGTIDTLAFWT